MEAFWASLPVAAQDAIWAGALLLPLALIALVLIRGFAPWPLVWALMWRFRWANLAYLALIGISVGMGIGLLAQERALRIGTAQAADKFVLVVTAPGSEVTMMLATVYLQIVDAPLLDGAVYDAVATHQRVRFAAPLAYGDSYQGAPVVGTTAEFALHLSDGAIEGRLWEIPDEALVGVDVPLSVGDTFTPAHGHGAAAQDDAHAGTHITVVGRLSRSGSPWDKAILVPVEQVWSSHGLADGHATENEGQIGPPFDPDYFPGTPAILVQATDYVSYQILRQTFTRDRETMAFFPGGVLANLYRIMGDVRQAMTLMAVVTQVLVAASVLMGLFILSRLFSRQLALLRALGAPARFVMAVIWGYGAALTVCGAVLGGLIGWGAAAVLSRILAEQTGVAIAARLSWAELHAVCGFVGLTAVLALFPALAVLRGRIMEALRA